MEKNLGVMAWRCSQLLLAPVLLPLLASGTWGSTVVSEELHQVVGQNFSVRCQYKPEAGPYVPKSWCRQTSPNRCNRVVTTSEPRKAIKESQHAIWDDPEAGFFSVTITPLTEKDSAVYWCGSFNPSRNVINILRNISLVVSPVLSTLPPSTSIWLQTKMASSTLPPKMATWLPTSTVLTTSPEETTGSFINGSEHRNQSSPSSPGCISPRILVFVQYGLLLFKGLMLSVFCVVLCGRCCQRQEYTAETVKLEVTEYASLPDISESLGTFGYLSGCEKNAYSPSPMQ
ncbi:trem-like transcript 4 protein isoform X2 [Cricetulus griseus]|uniref:Trem-like transcript 4 protein isoform X2 n=1 Tax=Cricetulus griseus TaxID=10029 RepID=A0A9J7KB34_CRIGR|nr:trem-like transcript 4 protein isoform X2 [Cricetulus griseus]XP_035317864.1 trem-like transcript 4 protein isoform X2 [Cricetulus griseus]